MARSNSLAVCLLITRIFIILLMLLDKRNATLGYDLLLCTGIYHCLINFLFTMPLSVYNLII